MPDNDDTQLYDAYYFQHGCGRPYERSPEWLGFFGGIAEKIVSRIGPQTVLDAGCAMGFLVEGLRARGVEAFGVDISEYAMGKVPEAVQAYCWVGSVSHPFPRRYDLIVCIEVLEHLRQPDSEAAIANFCRFADDILFSSTPLDYREATHFNVQSPEYWADQFAQHGFVRDVDFDASFINPWAVRFRLNHEPPHRVIRDYERHFWLLWKENVDLRQLTVEMRDQLAADEQAVQALRAQLEALRTHMAAQEQELRAQLDAKEQELHARQLQWLDITSRPSWKLVQLLQRLRLFLAPPNTLREHLLNLAVRVVVERKP